MLTINIFYLHVIEKDIMILYNVTYISQIKLYYLLIIDKQYIIAGLWNFIHSINTCIIGIIGI